MFVKDDQEGGLHYDLKQFQFSFDVIDMTSEELCIFRNKTNNFTSSSLCGGYIELNISYLITETTDYSLVGPTNSTDQVYTD